MANGPLEWSKISHHYKTLVPTIQDKIRVRTVHCSGVRSLPGIVFTKELTHQLHSHQVTQQWVDSGHLEQQESPGHKHQHITAGEVIQKVLRQSES